MGRPRCGVVYGVWESIIHMQRNDDRQRLKLGQIHDADRNVNIYYQCLALVFMRDRCCARIGAKEMNDFHWNRNPYRTTGRCEAEWSEEIYGQRIDISHSFVVFHPQSIYIPIWYSNRIRPEAYRAGFKHFTPFSHSTFWSHSIPGARGCQVFSNEMCTQTPYHRTRVLVLTNSMVPEVGVTYPRIIIINHHFRIWLHFRRFHEKYFGWKWVSNNFDWICFENLENR